MEHLLDDELNRRRWRGAIRDRGSHGSRVRGAGLPRTSPCASLIERDTERINIGPGIRDATRQDLGSHVVRGPDQALWLHAGSRGSCILERQPFGDAKVEDLYLSGRGQHNVFRFDIAVDHSLAVSRQKRSRALDGDIEKFGGRQGRGDPLAQGGSLDVLHQQECLAVLFQNVVHLRNVRVIERGSAPGFAQKAASIALVRPHFGRQTLQSHAVASVLGRRPGRPLPCRRRPACARMRNRP